MKSAIVGLGVIGNVHKSLINKLGLNLVAVCDVDEHKLDSIDGVQKFSDYITMLDTVKPDVVHICTPHFLHADMIIEALSRNINVLCEKPLCIKIEDIDRILSAEKFSSAQLGVCHQNRYNKENVFLKNYLKDKNVVGGFANVVWNRDEKYYAQAEWRGKWNSEGGGVLINQALHTLDLMQWLVGMPFELTSNVSNLSLKNVIEVEDTASILCFGEKNFTFFATNAGCSDFPVSITIKTDSDVIQTFKNKVFTSDAVFDFDKDNNVYGKCCYGTGHQGLFADYYDCIETGRKFEIDGAEASKVIRIILSAYKSLGEKVKI